MLLWRAIYLIWAVATADAISLTLRRNVVEFSHVSDISEPRSSLRRIVRRGPSDESRRGFQKRSVAESTYAYGLTSYMAQLYFGTPLKPVDCYIATFDSDTWITDLSAKVESQCIEPLYGGPCGPFEYNYRNSTSVDTSLGYTNFSRTGNLELAGFYASDIVSLDMGDKNFTFPNMTFGLATNASEEICVLGLGPVNGVTTGVTMENGIVYPTYNNVPVLAKSLGYTQSASYSLYFGETSGNLIFGSVDHAKYIGNLSVVPIVDYSLGNGRFLGSSSQPLTIQTMLHGVSAIDANGAFVPMANTSIPVQIGVGLPLCYIPESIINMIVVVFGMAFSEELGLYVADCNISGFIQLDLSGVIYTVPIQNFLATVIKENNQCPLLILPSMQAYYVLGDPFTSSVFLAVDFDNLELGIAPARHTNKTDVEPIISGIPRGVYAPGYNATLTFNQVRPFNFSANYTAPIPISLNHSPSSSLSFAAVLLWVLVGCGLAI